MKVVAKPVLIVLLAVAGLANAADLLIENVTVVSAHLAEPERKQRVLILDGQRLVRDVPRPRLWEERLESIREHERHLARNGTVILKFFLNVSPAEQAERLLARLDEPHKHWKVNPRDVAEREHWGAYMAAYQEALNATSRPWAPWYAIPADDKPFMRATVADLIARSLESLELRYPEARDEDRARFQELRGALLRAVPGDDVP